MYWSVIGTKSSVLLELKRHPRETVFIAMLLKVLDSSSIMFGRFISLLYALSMLYTSLTKISSSKNGAWLIVFNNSSCSLSGTHCEHPEIWTSSSSGPQVVTWQFWHRVKPKLRSPLFTKFRAPYLAYIPHKYESGVVNMSDFASDGVPTVFRVDFVPRGFFGLLQPILTDLILWGSWLLPGEL